MKKFLRRTLSTLALFGTALGGKMHAAGSEMKVDSEISNTSLSEKNGSGTNVSENFLISPTVQDIEPIFGDVFSEVNQAINSGRATHILTRYDELGVELRLPSENNVPHKYVTSALPETEYEAKVIIYKKLISYVVKARLKSLNKNLTSSERIKKFCIYKQLERDDEYIDKSLRSKNYEGYFQNSIDWISNCMSNRSKKPIHFWTRKSTIHMFNHKSAWTSLRYF